MKKCIRFFGGLISTQEKWLNKMAHNGYRLIKASKVSYEFEKCQPDAYQYVVEFVANKSYKSEKEYRSFLEDMGYTVFYKNINLNFSMGKVVWRPYGSGAGQISSNPGSYNKELFIVEKKNDGHSFSLHTTNSDKAAYYKPIRNSWLTLSILLIALCIWMLIGNNTFTKEVIIFGLIGILSFLPVIRYQLEIKRFIKASKIEE
jgi:glucan phosphoethanolaminetransferase (alkaline phosphatase superfamily)